ncbi:MAG TPA: hypothetical protein DCQ36_10155, partial [Actinobacteria bacterium]|nr:hypothetical protein [Actinomycetota bacterium]
MHRVSGSRHRLAVASLVTAAAFALIPGHAAAAAPALPAAALTSPSDVRSLAASRDAASEARAIAAEARLLR